MELSPLAPGLSSLFMIVPWHVLNIPLTRHDYPGNIHLGRNTPVQGGTGGDKACRTSFSLIQIMLRIKGDSIHMGKHPESTLDGPHNCGVFFQAYMLREEIITHMTISEIFWYPVDPRSLVTLIPYGCRALYKMQSNSPQVIN